MRIVNDGRLAQFHEQIDALLARRHDVAGVDIAMRPRHGPDHNQLFRCLAILEVEGRPLSCDEIQRLSANDGQVIRHNNANKVLKTVPALAKRIDPGATGDVSRVQYEVLEAGRTYLALMRARRGYVR